MNEATTNGFLEEMDLSGCAVKLDHSVGTPDPLPSFR